MIVVSLEGPADALLTQKQYPNLVVLADEGRGLSEPAGLIHEHASPDGRDAATPTTILVDRRGTVRWLFRPDAVITRLSPDEVLSAIDRHVRGEP